MKLNPDCIRDILLSVEDNTGYQIYLAYPDEIDKCPRLLNYTDEEIRYHMLQCKYSGLIFMQEEDLDGNIAIKDLTPDGHKFLANVRENKIWNGVKNISAKVGSASLDALTQIASNVVTELIKAQFGITSPTDRKSVV